jgi:hypothetical protein
MAKKSSSAIGKDIEKLEAQQADLQRELADLQGKAASKRESFNIKRRKVLAAQGEAIRKGTDAAMKKAQRMESEMVSFTTEAERYDAAAEQCQAEIDDVAGQIGQAQRDQASARIGEILEEARATAANMRPDDFAAWSSLGQLWSESVRKLNFLIEGRKDYKPYIMHGAYVNPGKVAHQLHRHIISVFNGTDAKEIEFDLVEALFPDDFNGGRPARVAAQEPVWETEPREPNAQPQGAENATSND